MSWLPVDICASTILGLAFPEAGRYEHSSNDMNDPNLVYHVLNPQNIHWTRDLLPALRRTKLPKFEAVDITEWLIRLHGSNPDPIKNPTAKLYDFYAGKYGAIKASSASEATKVAVDGTDENIEGLLFETHKTIAHYPLLGKVPPLIEQGYIDRYVDSWLQKWIA